MRLLVVCAALVGTSVAGPALGATLIQMPEGGRPVPVAYDGVVCGPLPAGWGLEADRRSVRPPPEGSESSRVIDVKLAREPSGCAKTKNAITLAATGRWPELDAAGIVFAPDEGRVELRGKRLKGVQILWEAGGKAGQDNCLDPKVVDKVEQCTVPVTRGLPVDATLRWLPAGARFGKEIASYDVEGRPVDPDLFLLRPARTIVNGLFPTGAGTLDISQGTGRIPLLHPRAIASVDCGVSVCELGEGGIIVRGVPAPATSVTVRLRLAPRMFVDKGTGSPEVSHTQTFPLVHCPLTVISGPPLRDADDSQVLVRMDRRCGSPARVRWMVSGEPADVVRTATVNDAPVVQLRAGRIVRDTVTITAFNAGSDAGIVGSVTAKTAPAPRPRATLELPGHGRVEFIPTNREAVLTVGGAGERAKLVPLGVDGVYGIRTDNGRYLVRGDESASGFVSLRFGYRIEGLPAEFAGADLAIISEQVQRAVREASVPAAFGGDQRAGDPLAELLCADDKGEPWRLPPGKHVRIPFDQRDTCRVIIHQERLRSEDGLQEIVLEIDVTRVDGARRSESERLVLRPGGEPRVFWLREPTAQFDRIVVRLSHVIDESRYVISPTARKALPSVQWSATVEGGWARLYATVAIPAGLYRMNEPTGQLTLNFGVLSRITSLDRSGKEGLVGAELGLMGVGLIQRQGGVPSYPATLAAVAGLGVRVPLGQGAAVGVHVWGAYEFRRAYYYDLAVPTDPQSGRRASHWAFIFGPSISIGNVGFNL